MLVEEADTLTGANAPPYSKNLHQKFQVN